MFSAARLIFRLAVGERLCVYGIYLYVVLQRVLPNGLQRTICCNALCKNRVVPAPWVKVSMVQEWKRTLAAKGRTGTRAAVHVAAKVLHGVSGVFPSLAGRGAVRRKRPPHRATPPTAQDSSKRSAELTAVTRVDDGVHAAVEVTEPEDEFEDGFWRTQVSVEGDWKRRTKAGFTFQEKTEGSLRFFSRLDHRPKKHKTHVSCFPY